MHSSSGAHGVTVRAAVGARGGRRRRLSSGPRHPPRRPAPTEQLSRAVVAALADTSNVASRLAAIPYRLSPVTATGRSKEAVATSRPSRRCAARLERCDLFMRGPAAVGRAPRWPVCRVSPRPAAPFNATAPRGARAVTPVAAPAGGPGAFRRPGQPGLRRRFSARLDQITARRRAVLVLNWGSREGGCLRVPG